MLEEVCVTATLFLPSELFNHCPQCPGLGIDIPECLYILNQRSSAASRFTESDQPGLRFFTSSPRIHSWVVDCVVNMVTIARKNMNTAKVFNVIPAMWSIALKTLFLVFSFMILFYDFNSLDFQRKPDRTDYSHH